MIGIPCPDQNRSKKSLTSKWATFLVAVLFVSPLFAETHHLQITMPEIVHTNTDLKIKIEAMDKENNLVSDEGRDLTLKIFNGSKEMTQSISLLEGIVETNVSLENPGATLIMVSDNNKLIAYSSREIRRSLEAGNK